MKLSVIIATHQRQESLLRLLAQLARQDLPPEEFEVKVVDDGSHPPVRERLRSARLPYSLQLLEQSNAGAAAARHLGALAARGDLLLFVDDDMQVGPDFLRQHLLGHLSGSRRVLLGRISPDPSLPMPLFERWHARQLEQLAERARAGLPLRGTHLFTGNVSMRREDYLSVGGFDPSLGQSEDVELGLRLEKTGVELRFSDQAYVLHASDHTRLDRWLSRARRYGGYDFRIWKKHRDAPHASPWRFLFELHPLARPFLALAVLAPRSAAPLSRSAMLLARALDALGVDAPALAGTTLAYGSQYMGGARVAAGSLVAALTDLGDYWVRSGKWPPLSRFLEAVRADHQAMREGERRYGHRTPSRGNLAWDLAQKIGFQELFAYRVMRLLLEGGSPLGAKLVSRLIRHLYGSDLHWEAELEPGVVIIHGMGLAIAHSARVAQGCILSQNVTLGLGMDPLSGERGAPRLEPRVHLGPGATLLGPIVVGQGSKVGPQAVLRHSVKPRSVVEVPPPTVRARERAPFLAPPPATEGRPEWHT